MSLSLPDADTGLEIYKPKCAFELDVSQGHGPMQRRHRTMSACLPICLSVSLSLPTTPLLCIYDPSSSITSSLVLRCALQGYTPMCSPPLLLGRPSCLHFPSAAPHPICSATVWLSGLGLRVLGFKLLAPYSFGSSKGGKNEFSSDMCVFQHI